MDQISQQKPRLINLNIATATRQSPNHKIAVPLALDCRNSVTNARGYSHHIQSTSENVMMNPQKRKSKTKTATKSTSSRGPVSRSIVTIENRRHPQTFQSVIPYRTFNQSIPSKTRKNVFFSESEVGQDEDSTYSSDNEGHYVSNIRHASATHSKSGGSLSKQSGSACHASPPFRLNSTSFKPESPRQVTSATPRPGTSRQRNMLHRGRAVEEVDCAKQVPDLQSAGLVVKEKRMQWQTPRKASDKKTGRRNQTPRKMAQRNRCRSTASVDDAISSSGSSSNISSPRGLDTHRHADSSLSSVDSPLPNSVIPGTARSIEPSSATTIITANYYNNQNSAWSMFETHVKLIDDYTGNFYNVPRRTFMSSPVFRSVMTDLYGRPDYSKTRAFLKFRSRVGDVAAYASRFLGRVKALHGMRTSSGDTDDDEDDDFFDEFDGDTERRQPSAQTIENARRGWRILKNHVMEEAAKKRMSRPALAWDVIRLTLRAGSNLERARLDIYQRYGLVPMVLPDGRVVQENTMLSERARNVLANKSQKAATSDGNNSRQARQSLTTTVSTRRTLPYKAIEGFCGYSRSETM
ncbi:hypothetical protein PoB_004590200 [Plakobranchus ocellatus]|uniref:Retrotransposon gag domain-containing protein n=1 Tax=Plakobranchus ocellatus TaxID=259542 RepID=A0AAV4BKG9_9GAST|nr:hypothetical protein PoB_004590200 [Plakobranchus ocellatus]